MASVGDIIKTTLFHSVPNSGEALLVFHHVVETADMFNNNLKAAVIDWVENDWGPDWADLGALVAEINRVLIQKVNTAGEILLEIADETVDVPGNVATPCDAAGVAGFMHASTAQPKVRGRKFIPGIADEKLSNGKLTATALAELAILATHYIEDIPEPVGGGQLGPGVRSNSLSAFVPFSGSVVITDIPAYQRRRKPGVGS